ncbi:peptidoglycan-binding protein [Streptomyces niveus]|uniref:peptidoglycan-binding protein n=1 Tax=Streptomyces niveus TaxID=193462 RepID=UPI0033DE107D
MTTEVEKVLSVAAGEVGVKETRAGGHWVNDSKYNQWYGKIPGYGRNGMNYPWCAVYVAWVADKAGLKALYPKTAGCATAVNWFKNKGRFSFYPAVGAQVFYGANGFTHTGIVYKYDEDHIWTYEGNTSANSSPEGDGVYAKKWARKASYVYGYGYPEFSEGIVTADPSKKDKAGHTYKVSASAPSKPVTPKPPAPKPSIPAFPGASHFGSGKNNKYVTQLGNQLVKKGYGRFYTVGPGPKWSESDRKAVAAFQKAQKWTGVDADGYPGPETWKRLFS